MENPCQTCLVRPACKTSECDDLLSYINHIRSIEVDCTHVSKFVERWLDKYEIRPRVIEANKYEKSM